MTAGKLLVSPVTISGLAQNGYPNFQCFIGCYVLPSEKHRTHSLKGPEPQYQDTLQCNIGKDDHTLSLDVINEDQERPGLVGSGQVSLNKVFETERFEDWVPIIASTGATVGYIFTRLNFTPAQPKQEQDSPYGLPPSPPSYSHQSEGLAEGRKVEIFHSGSQNPMPNYSAQQQAPSHSAYPYKNSSNNGFIQSSSGTPPAANSYYNSSSNSMQYGNSGVPPSIYTPLGQTNTTGELQSASYDQSSLSPSPTTTQSPPIEKSKKKEVPNWMKYGGAALAGAAAVGIGSLVVNAFDSDEEDEEATKRAQHEAEQRRLAEEYYYAQTHQSQSRGVDEKYPSEETYQPPSFEQEQEIEVEERDAEEEEAQGELEEHEREEELEEQEEFERPVINDSKWR